MDLEFQSFLKGPLDTEILKVTFRLCKSTCLYFSQISMFDLRLQTDDNFLIFKMQTTQFLIENVLPRGKLDSKEHFTFEPFLSCFKSYLID